MASVQSAKGEVVRAHWDASAVAVFRSLGPGLLHVSVRGAKSAPGPVEYRLGRGEADRGFAGGCGVARGRRVEFRQGFLRVLDQEGGPTGHTVVLEPGPNPNGRRNDRRAMESMEK